VPVVAKIARRLGVDLWRARLQRRGRVDGGRLLGIIDIDEFGGIARLGQRLGDDDRHRVADIADPVDRQHRVRRFGHRRAVLRMDLPAAGQTTYTVGRHVLAGVHGDNPGRSLRRRGIDARDPRMRVGAAQDVCIELAGTIDIVGVGTSSGQKAVILTPAERRSDRRHGLTPRPPHGHWAAPRHASPPHPRRSPARYCDNRCSGRGCPRDTRGFRARSGWGYS